MSDLEDFETVPDTISLPAWFTKRMVEDNWYFGLLLTTGQVLCISQIDAINRAADGTIWLDVDMLAEGDLSSIYPLPGKPVFSPTSRRRASVNASHVVAGFELADT